MNLVNIIKNKLKKLSTVKVKDKTGEIKTGAICVDLSNDYYEIKGDFVEIAKFRNYLKNKFPNSQANTISINDPLSDSRMDSYMVVVLVEDMKLLKQTKNSQHIIPLIVNKFGEELLFIKKEWWDVYEKDKATLH